MAGANFTRTVVTLTAGQAAGTEVFLAADRERGVVMVRPPADCELTLAPAETMGLPLFGGVPNFYSGRECPTNALYIYGATAGDVIVVWAS